jgi:hypothetical protein
MCQKFYRTDQISWRVGDEHTRPDVSNRISGFKDEPRGQAKKALGVHVEKAAACGIGHDRERATVMMPTFRG